MARDADVEARVRARMERTGEDSTTARAATLAAHSRTRDALADKAVRSFFDGDQLRSIPTKRQARAAVLMHLLLRFERGRNYPEREVNEILRTAHPDISTLRRELVDYGWLRRAEGIYRVVDGVPDRSPDELQEVPADEAARLARVSVRRT